MRKLFLKPPRCAILLGFFCIWASLNAQITNQYYGNWKAYFPLEVGREWQMQTTWYRQAIHSKYEKWTVSKDTLIAGRRFYFLDQRLYGRVNGIDDQFFMRYTDWLSYNEDLKQIDYIKEWKAGKPVVAWWRTLPCGLDQLEAVSCGDTEADRVEYYINTSGRPVGIMPTKGFEKYPEGIGIWSYTENVNLFALVGPSGVAPYRNGQYEPDNLYLLYTEAIFPDGSWTTFGQFSFPIVKNDWESPQQTSIKLFPNPVRDKLQIRVEEEVDRVLVYNILGQVVQVQRVDLGLEMSLDISGLNSGNYLLRISFRNGEMLQKLITKI